MDKATASVRGHADGIPMDIYACRFSSYDKRWMPDHGESIQVSQNIELNLLCGSDWGIVLLTACANVQ